MSAFHRITAGVVALASLVAVSAAQLLPGSPAPKIEVTTWVKGSPVTKFDNKKLYVVEFWATWCGPCKQSIPHLTELAKKNKDVTFIGVSIWEQEAPVAPFVKEMGSKMNYNVAYGGNQGGMAMTWMQAAGQNGIPTAFIVKEGKVVWIGHPMTMEEPLAKAKAGTLDVEAERKAILAQVEATKKQREAMLKLQAADKLHTDGKKAEASAALDEIVKSSPELKGQVDDLRSGWMAVDDPVACDKFLDGLIGEKTPDSRNKLFQFAMKQVKYPAAKPLAVKAAEGVAAGIAENDVIFRYQAALVLSQLKENAKALPLAEAAVAALPKSEFKDNADAKKAVEGLRDQIKKAAG